MNPSPIARKLNCPGRKMPARNATIVRTTAAKKQIVETIRNCRSTQKHQLKSCAGAWQTSVYLRSRDEIPTTVNQYEHQTSYSRNSRRLCRSVGDRLSYTRSLDDARLPGYAT